MIRHTLMFRFRPEVDATMVDSILAELETFPGHYPQMRDWSSGLNISSRDKTFTHVFSVEFATEQDLLSYLTSESHERFVRERWRPVIEAQAIASYEYAAQPAPAAGPAGEARQ